MKKNKLDKSLIGQWVWCSRHMFPVYVIDVKGDKVRFIFSDFSGGERWRSHNEIESMATKKEVLEELRSSYRQIKNNWGKELV